MEINERGGKRETRKPWEIEERKMIRRNKLKEDGDEEK